MTVGPVHFRHGVPAEAVLAHTCFSAAIALTPGDLQISFGELSAVVAEAEERPV